MDKTTLLIISLISALIVNILRKTYASLVSGKTIESFVFSAVCAVVATIVLTIWGGISSTSIFTLILGVIFGLITATQYVFNLKALETGPLSYTQVIISFSTIIPTLSGVLFFGETIELIQVFGIILILISLLLSIDKSKNNKKSSFKWLAYCMIAFVCTGLIGVMQKVHQKSQFASELNSFLVIAFLISFLFASTVSLVICKRENSFIIFDNKSKKSKLFILLCMLCCGIFIAVNNKLNLYLSGVIDSAIFFPIVNGGGLVLATLASLVLFKEKLSVKRWLGVVLGIISVILLCNPF